MPYTIKRGDTARSVSDNLSMNGVPIDLTGASVVLVLSVLSIEAKTTFRRTASITDASNGGVEYQFINEDVRNSGMLSMEWEITFADGSVLKVPDSQYILIRVVPDLG